MSEVRQPIRKMNSGVKKEKGILLLAFGDSQINTVTNKESC